MRDFSVWSTTITAMTKLYEQTYCACDLMLRERMTQMSPVTVVASCCCAFSTLRLRSMTIGDWREIDIGSWV